MASHAFNGRATDVLNHDLPHITPQRPPMDKRHFYNVVSTHNPAITLTTIVESLLKDTTVLPGTAQRKAHRHVLQLRAAYDATFEKHDVLVIPTTPAVAPPLPDMSSSNIHGQSNVERMLRLAAGAINNPAPFNVSGQPALSVPYGWDTAARGDCMLPVGIQIVGRRFNDLGVLKAARSLSSGVVN